MSSNSKLITELKNISEIVKELILKELTNLKTDIAELQFKTNSKDQTKLTSTLIH